MGSYEEPGVWCAWIDPASGPPARQFIDQVGTVQRLSDAELGDLRDLVVSGDYEARVRVVEAHLQLAVFVAGDHADRGVLTLDLLQDAMIGLIRAVEVLALIPPGVAFVDFAAGHIRQAIEEHAGS